MNPPPNIDPDVGGDEAATFPLAVWEDLRPAPWRDEPDRVDGTAHGFPYIILRSASGALCGYVGVPWGHPFYGYEYWYRWRSPASAPTPTRRAFAALRVHGGLTYSADALPALYRRGWGTWWLGFDCAHHFDRVPSIEEALAATGYAWRSLGGIYRTLDYVRGQCFHLAAQLRLPALEARR